MIGYTRVWNATELKLYSRIGEVKALQDFKAL